MRLVTESEAYGLPKPYGGHRFGHQFGGYSLTYLIYICIYVYIYSKVYPRDFHGGETSIRPHTGTWKLCSVLSYLVILISRDP